MCKLVAVLSFLLLALGISACNNTVENNMINRQIQHAETSSSTEIVERTDEISQTYPFDFETRTVTLNSGYEMPIMGLGTYSLSDEECYNSVMALLEAGGRLIDTAYMYHNEAGVGRAVRESGIPREEIFVITKLYPSQFGNPEAAIEEAIEKMDIGYIDMMLLHHPGEGDVEAYLTMEKAVSEGKIRSIGLSKMEYRFICVQC